MLICMYSMNFLHVIPAIPPIHSPHQGKRKRCQQDNDHRTDLKQTTAPADLLNTNAPDLQRATVPDLHQHATAAATECIHSSVRGQPGMALLPQQPLNSSNDAKECERQAAGKSGTVGIQPPSGGSPYVHHVHHARIDLPTPGDDGGIWDSLLGQ